ncbi:MAG: AAA family ATPase [Flavobacteriales bacterium]|jgi:uridine kinase|nr:AAA family ATPase [Flavobacteriales bacterium]
MNKPYIVGLAGGSGSGKSSFIRDLAALLPPAVVAVVQQDNYYLPRSQQKADGNGKINFDVPDAIDRKTLFNDVEMLRNGCPVEKEEYTFNHPDKKPQILTIAPAPIVFVEGLFVFHFSELARLFDVRIFLDADDSVMLERRLLRDASERGYPMEEVLYQWHHHVMPAYQQFLMPYRSEAHIVVNNNTDYRKALEVMADHLHSII